jgi:hypothetical protein
MRRTAPPSRPYGRYAVGLRPSLDPDAYFDAPSQDKEARRTNPNNTEVGLDRPRSFRNDLQFHWLSQADCTDICLTIAAFPTMRAGRPVIDYLISGRVAV